MQLLTGAGTSWQWIEAVESPQRLDNDHIWEVLFAYHGPEACREVAFGGQTHSSLDLRRYLMGKQKDADEVWDSGGGEGERCVFCRHTFGSAYADPFFGTITIRRNLRNRYYCNQCDYFIRACPGQTTLEMPVLVVDVRHSREIRERTANLAEYSRLLLRFRRNVAVEIQRNLGFVLNTIGDAVLSVWPSGFVPDDVRERLGWSSEHPARIPATLAIRTAESLARLAPADFDGVDLPFRGVVDTTEMAIFSVVTCDPEQERTFAAHPDDHAGEPVSAAPEGDDGTVAVDVAGEAVEVASMISSHDAALAGRMYVTRRTDLVAATDAGTFDYEALGGSTVKARVV